MPRIRCHYDDCVFIEDGYCGAAAVEVEPDSGCMTYRRADEAEKEEEWEEDEFEDELEEEEDLYEEEDEEESDDLWDEDDEDEDEPRYSSKRRR